MKRKTLITKCAYPWGDFAPTHAINHYLGCAFNCDYCWSRDVWWKRMGGHLGKVWGVPEDFEWRYPLPFEDIQRMLADELEGGALLAGSKVLLCSTTDPYQPMEAQAKITRWILQELASLVWARDTEVMILTKAALLPERDFEILKSMDAWFGVTMEYRPTRTNWYYARATTLYQAHQEGIHTFVSLEPWIPGIDAIQIVLDLVDFTDHFIVGALNYRGANLQFYRDNLGSLIECLEKNTASWYIKPDLMKFSERGDG